MVLTNKKVEVIIMGNSIQEIKVKLQMYLMEMEKVEMIEMLHWYEGVCHGLLFALSTFPEFDSMTEYEELANKITKTFESARDKKRL
jgi:hypothetical protein